MRYRVRTIVTLCLLLIAPLTLSGCGFKTAAPTYSTKLEVWGVFDDSDTYKKMFAEYRSMNPYVKEINYRKLNVDTYKQDLLDALASGKGPDIFMIRNSWVPSFQDKIVTAPTTFADERSFREAFVDVVADDFLGPQNQVYGVPLSVDSLALYYNKDIFTAAGILAPPSTWEEFTDDVMKLTSVDGFGTVNQSGAAIGTAYNINRSTDILAAMMLQAGVPLHSDDNQGVNFRVGTPAINFYTQFADTRSPSYTWNSDQHYSIDAFFEGKTAMMINYSWQYATLKHKNAKLNIGLAPLPQFAQGSKANYANYWGYAVAKNKDFGDDVADKATAEKVRLHESWQLLKYMTMPNNGAFTFQNALTGAAKETPLTNDPSKDYMLQTGKPAARRDLTEATRRDLILGPFAEGNIIAKNWKQTNPEAVESIFAEMIDSVNRGSSTIANAVTVVENRLRYLVY